MDRATAQGLTLHRLPGEQESGSSHTQAVWAFGGSGKGNTQHQDGGEVTRIQSKGVGRKVGKKKEKNIY